MTDWLTDWSTDWLTDWHFSSESRFIARQTNSQNRYCAASCYWVCMWRRRPVDVGRRTGRDGGGDGRSRDGARRRRGRGLGRGREGGTTAHPRHLVSYIFGTDKSISIISKPFTGSTSHNTFNTKLYGQLYFMTRTRQLQIKIAKQESWNLV